MEDSSPTFFIGHHDPKRPLPVTSEAVRDAHSANVSLVSDDRRQWLTSTQYDMVTSPITTPHFHSRVLALLSFSLSESFDTGSSDFSRVRNWSPIVVAPLSPADTPLTPDDTTSQIIGTTSPWIDLSSPDPIIADVSKQVLKLELSYAAFCGITHVLISSPRLNGRTSDDSIVQYARSILEGLDQGPYMQLYIWLPLIHHRAAGEDEIGDLAPFARQQYLQQNESTDSLDLFGTWEAWNTIRSICKYSSRLSLGKNCY